MSGDTHVFGRWEQPGEGRVRSTEGRGAAIRIWARLSQSSETGQEQRRAEHLRRLTGGSPDAWRACEQPRAARHQSGPGAFRAWSGAVCPLPH